MLSMNNNLCFHFRSVESIRIVVFAIVTVIIHGIYFIGDTLSDQSGCSTYRTNYYCNANSCFFLSSNSHAVRIKTIELSNNTIQCIQPLSFEGGISIKTLNLSHNEDNFDSVTNLKYLDVSFNSVDCFFDICFFI